MTHGPEQSALAKISRWNHLVYLGNAVIFGISSHQHLVQWFLPGHKMIFEPFFNFNLWIPTLTIPCRAPFLQNWNINQSFKTYKMRVLCIQMVVIPTHFLCFGWLYHYTLVLFCQYAFCEMSVIIFLHVASSSNPHHQVMLLHKLNMQPGVLCCLLYGLFLDL